MADRDGDQKNTGNKARLEGTATPSKKNKQKKEDTTQKREASLGRRRVANMQAVRADGHQSVSVYLHRFTPGNYHVHPGLAERPVNQPEVDHSVQSQARHSDDGSMEVV